MMSEFPLVSMRKKGIQERCRVQGTFFFEYGCSFSWGLIPQLYGKDFLPRLYVSLITLNYCLINILAILSL
jgi:hypothetical protein